MANTFLIPSLIGQQALATLYETNVMAGLVFRDYDNEFTGKQGDTVTIRKPWVPVAQEFSRPAGITIQDITETGIPVTLNHLVDVSTEITAEQKTLSLDKFNERVLAPMMEAVAQKIDADLLALRADITQNVGTTSGELWSMPEAMIAAGRVLTQAKVPPSQRRAVVGPVTAAEWLKTDLLKKADARGDTAGRINASLGSRLFGFDAYETNHITVPAQVSGNSTTEVGIAFHQTAFALVTRALALPDGAKAADYASYDGFTLRVVIDYDINRKADVLSIDTLYGVKTMDANRAVQIRGALN